MPPARSEPTAQTASECLICGRADPIGLGVCPSCAATGDNTDTLVFLNPVPERSHDRATGVLRVLHPEADGTEQTTELLRGERPLFKVPRKTAQKIAEWLAERSVATRLISHKDVMWTLPARMYVFMLAVLMIGIWAGIVADSRLLITSPLVALLLWLLAGRVASRPFHHPAPTDPGFAPALRRHVVSLLTKLPPGTGRNLLATLSHAGGLFRARMSRPDLTLDDAVQQLTYAACDRVEYLTRIENQIENLQRLPPTQRQNHNILHQFLDAKRDRQRVVQLLQHATSVVARTRSQQLRSGDKPESNLVDATRALRRQIEAREEVEGLLRT